MTHNNLGICAALVVAVSLQGGANMLQLNPSKQLPLLNKEHIQLEEPYRQEARKSPSEAEDAFQRVLNAPFTLWLLSSVFIALWTWAYGRFHDSRERRKARTERILRIFIDLKVQLMRVRSDFDALKRGEASAWPAHDNIKGAFPEFSGRDFYSLVAELGIHLPGSQLPEQLNEAWRKLLVERSEDNWQEVDLEILDANNLIDKGVAAVGA